MALILALLWVICLVGYMSRRKTLNPEQDFIAGSTNGTVWSFFFFFFFPPCLPLALSHCVSTSCPLQVPIFIFIFNFIFQIPEVGALVRILSIN
jgi:hypothetical protein